MYMSRYKTNKKIIVFDMDETLGYFTQLGIFISILEDNIKRRITNQEFNLLMDLFPLYQRTNILSILNYIKEKKQQQQCYKVYIYTNNQGPKYWGLQIKQYFESKLNYPLFDKVIHAYKVNGVQIENNRTSHNKSILDLLKCTKLTKNVSICFIDDQYHPYMLKPNSYYLHVKEYQYLYDPNVMFEKFKQHFQLNDNQINILKNTDKDIFIHFNNESHKIKKSQEKISKQILHHLDVFFNKDNKDTKKHYLKSHKTQKNIKHYHYKRIF